MSESELGRPRQLEELWVEVGARSADEVAALGIEIGAPVTLRSTPRLARRAPAGRGVDRQPCRLRGADRGGPRRCRPRARRRARPRLGRPGGGRVARGQGAAQILQPTVAVVVDTLPAGDPSTPAPAGDVGDWRRPGHPHPGRPRRDRHDLRARDPPPPAGARTRRRDRAPARRASRPGPTPARSTSPGAGSRPAASSSRGCAATRPTRCSTCATSTRTIALLAAFAATGAAEVERLATRPSFPLGQPEDR